MNYSNRIISLTIKKMMDLLDLILFINIINNVKILRIIMEIGVKPLALMSQLATVIIDICKDI